MITVTGQVTDMLTGDGLPGATLSVNGKAAAAADLQGNFLLQVENYNDSITASNVDYTTVTRQAFDVAESGMIELQPAPDNLETDTVTAALAKKISPWWILAGVAVVASTSKPSRRTSSMAGKGSSNLIPLAALGVGAYLLLKPSTPVYNPYPAGYPYPTPTPTSPSGSSLFTPGNLSSLFDAFKGLFAGENSPSGTYTSYDPTSSGGDLMAGTRRIGATTTVNAGDIIGHSLIAAQRVPVYDEANDNAQPSGYVSTGQPVGIVYSYLSPDPSKGRSGLWWMFEPLPDSSEIGDSLGYYYTPHNPDYFDFQALSDSGVLTVAQATALKNGTAPSTAEKLLDKYLPWVIGGIVAIGIGKAVINKVV